jgi:glycosyltransferase involved in cell wall biosynthesis
MRVLVTAAARFIMSDDGHLWAPDTSHSYKLWSRYLDIYDEVNLLVRAKYSSTIPSGWKMATGSGVKAIPISYFIGPWEFIKKYRQIKKTINEALINVEAIHLRIPCSIGTEVWHLLPSARPYGVEVVADPYDVFAPGSVKHPLRPLFRWLFTKELKQQCFQAPAALYVTNTALQQRYPCPNYSIGGVSNVCLPEKALVSTSRLPRPQASCLRAIFVGTMDQLYKAPDILIDAVAICVREGLNINLVMVGDGKHRKELEAKAKAGGLEKRIFFPGQLASSEAVRAELDRADLFVLPSYQEGLPRAMIEAMARSLPCIGSTAGGIPELLSPEDMVTPGNATALAQKIREVLTNPKRMALMSARNLEKAKQYTDEILRHKRIAFYRYVHEQTEVWLRQAKK